MSARNLSMWSLRTLAIALVAALPFAAAPAHAQDAHGAIAFGHSDKAQAAAYGFAWNYSSQDEAQTAARNACSAAGGADCVVLSWFRNGCGALAMDRYGRAEGTSAMSEDRAEARAMQTCQSGGGSGCSIVAAACAQPGGQARTWSGRDSVLAVEEERSGARPAAAGKQREAALSRDQRIQVQRGLAALGFDAGPPDGLFGRQTRSAIWEWQQAKGLEPSGYLSRDQAEALSAAAGEMRQPPAAQQATTPTKSPNQVLTFAPPGPQCAQLKGRLKEGDRRGCWWKTAGAPGCYFWEHVSSYGLKHIRKIRWAGACPGGLADGPGSLHVDFGEEDDLPAVGAFKNGKRQGRWINPYDDDSGTEGHYREGLRHGRWVYRWPNGSVDEGNFVRDKWHGWWTTRERDGKCTRTRYEHGKEMEKTGC